MVYPEALANTGVVSQARELLGLSEGSVNTISAADELWERPLPGVFKELERPPADPERLDVARLLLGYIGRTHGLAIEHISTIVPYLLTENMTIDAGTVRNLELVESLREK